jgi:uncharacterized protein (DUF1697 family)
LFAELKHMRESSVPSLQAYTAFLRGINVGGNKVLKMADVKKAFESLGLREVKTLGASGNVAFVAPRADAAGMARRIEGGLQAAFGQTVSVIVLTLDRLRQMIDSAPFKGVKITPQTRLYVTFVAGRAQSKSSFAVPYQSPDKVFRILKVHETELYTVVDLSTGGSTLDAMDFIEKQFGKNVTTRNWNTIEKLAKAATTA